MKYSNLPSKVLINADSKLGHTYFPNTFFVILPYVLVFILLECPETNDWRMEMLCKTWLDINEEIAYRKVLSCPKKKKKKITVKNNGKFLFRVKCKWEGKVNKLGI
jgi:hypothetical protein